MKRMSDLLINIFLTAVLDWDAMVIRIINKVSTINGVSGPNPGRILQDLILDPPPPLLQQKHHHVVEYFAKSCASPDNPMAKLTALADSRVHKYGQPSERGFILHICCHKPCLIFAADVKTTSVETILSCRDISVYKLTNIRFGETSIKVQIQSRCSQSLTAKIIADGSRTFCHSQPSPPHLQANRRTLNTSEISICNMWEQLCISRDVIKFEIFLGFSQSSYNWNQCLPISDFLITVDLRIVGRCFIRSSTMVMITIFASLLPFKQHSTIIIAVVKIISQVINMFSWGFSQTGRLQVSEIWADTT